MCFLELVLQIVDMFLLVSFFVGTCRSVAASEVNLFEEHPKFRAVGYYLDNFRLSEHLEFVQQRWLLIVSFQLRSGQNCFDDETNDATTVLLLEAELMNDLLTLADVCSVRHEGSVQDYLEGCPVSELVPFNEGAELRNVEVNFGEVLQN